MNRGTGAALGLLAAALALQAQPQSSREAAQLDAEGRCADSEPYYAAALRNPTPATLNNAGNHYLVCGDSEKARRYFEQLLKINPAHANANLQLARLAAEARQGRKALDHLAKANETGPVVALIRAEALHWAGQPSAGAKVLDGVLAAAESDPRLLVPAGLAAARMELYERAEAAFGKALAQQPGDFELLFNLGRAASRAKHYDRGQRALEAALRLSPSDAGVLVELGRVSAARQDYVRAVFLLAQARKLEPGNADIVLMLARAAEDARYYEDASLAYDDYLRLRPGDEQARRDRARAYGMTEARREDARKELDRYIAKHPDDAAAHYIFAQVFWHFEPEASLRHLDEAVRLEPDSANYRFSRAWMRQGAGRMAESLPDLEAANRLAPGSARVLDLIGLAHLASDDADGAEKVLRKAIALAPDDPEINLHLGRALMALGREDEAQARMERFAKLRPQGLPGVRTRLGMIELATLAAPEQRGREIERYQREAAEHPDRPDYQLHLSSLLLADGRTTDALEQFRRLLAMNANAQVWEQAGSLLLGSGQYELAKEFLKRAAPERPGAALELAAAVFSTEGPEPALAILDGLPREAAGDALLLRADILDAAGRRAEAEQALDEALGRVTAQSRSVQRAVPLILRLGRSQVALKLLDDAASANPEDPDLALSRALLLAVTQRFDAAEKAMRDIESRWPEWDRGYLAHALLLEHSGKKSEARRKLKAAEALGSREAALACALGRVDGAGRPSPECACASPIEQLLTGRCQ